jgi:hypothetical protein
VHKTRLLALALALLGAAACNDFLTGGELSTDPNRPRAASDQQLFVGVQDNVWSLLGSDPPRVTSLWAQQLTGTLQQYDAIYNYGVNEQTTGGFHQALYVGGGLVDARRIQASAEAAHDSTFLGVAQVQEALLIGTGADLFGDLVYSQALGGKPNPALDEQLAVYDALQALLDRAIVNLAARGGPNIGPGAADLSYGGDPARWQRLAHTLKARLYLHTAEVRPAAYALARAQAAQGIVDRAGDFKGIFSGAAFEENFWYQFGVVQRQGYFAPNEDFVALLESRTDPRLADYFNADQSDLSDARYASNFSQPYVTAAENRLIWAEAAYRTGDPTTARAQLDAARAIAGLAPEPASLAGPALLREILTEKYVALFQTSEPWMDYKRTCFPNLVPVVAGRKIPARLFYDPGERQTNTSIPEPQDQPTRNDADPPNATDPFGNACLGQ